MRPDIITNVTDHSTGEAAPIVKVTEEYIHHGEQDYFPDARLPVSARTDKFVELPVSGLIAQMTVAIDQLQGFDADIQQTQERGRRIKQQISEIEKALANAQAEEKATVTAFARGNATQDAIKVAQGHVFTLTNESNGLKSAQEIITADLAGMTQPRDVQKKRVDRLKDRVWAAIEQEEFDKAKPFLTRAIVAGIQGRSDSILDLFKKLSGLLQHPSAVNQNREKTNEIAEEYGIPKC